MLRIFSLFRLWGCFLLAIFLFVSSVEPKTRTTKYDKPVIGVMYSTAPMWNRIGGVNQPWDISYNRAFSEDFNHDENVTLKGKSFLKSFDVYMLFWKRSVLLGVGRYERNPRRYEATTGPIVYAGGYTRSTDAWTEVGDKWTTIRAGVYLPIVTSEKRGKLSFGTIGGYCFGNNPEIIMQSYDKSTTPPYTKVNFHNNKIVYTKHWAGIIQFDLKYDFSFMPAALGVRLDGIGIGHKESQWRLWNTSSNTYYDGNTYLGGTGFLVKFSTFGFGIVPYFAMEFPLPF